MGFKAMPPCFKCDHLNNAGDFQTLTGWTCRAYPGGIPQEILAREEGFDHVDVFPGQTGEFSFTGKAGFLAGAMGHWEYEGGFQPD